MLRDIKCFFTVDKDGTETIWQVLPHRESDYWIADYGNSFVLPYGAVYKITGLRRTWTDAPLFWEQKTK
jgi:hypothetical protein